MTRFGLVLLSLVFGVSCAPQKNSSEKTISDVFPSEQSLKCEGESIKTRFLVEWADGRITVETADNRDAFIKHQLKPHLESIKRVEFDHRVRLIAPLISRFDKRATVLNWGIDMIKAEALWEKGFKGAGVQVAVVDSGTDVAHKQLAGQLAVNDAEATGEPGIDDDQNGYVDDIHGWDFVKNQPLTGDYQIHGTHVAGTILADPAHGDVKGVAPEARLLPLSFLAEDGTGVVADAVSAIQYAASRGARVINASWGGSGCSAILRDTIARLEEKGILFVAAAGNDGINIDYSPTYPASFARMGIPLLSVGASTDLDWQAGFSNEGYTSVHLLAPGMGIVSTVPNQELASLDGTSMAAPFVSGAAALLWSAYPEATLAQIREALLSGVDTGEFVVSTKGRLNVEKSLISLEKLLSVSTR